MIITVKNLNNLVKEEIRSYLESFPVEIHFLTYEGQEYIISAGDERDIDITRLKNFPSVIDVNTNVHPYHFASKKFKETPTVVNIGDFKIGGDDFAFIAGPCAVEDEKDLYDTAVTVKESGATLLRAGAFKPRTTPHNFQGLGKKGVERLVEVGKQVNMPIVTEVMNPEDVSWMEEVVDVFQVGTRNMTNTALLKRLGKTNRPVILKRSFSAGIEEWVKAAEFILVGGNPNVILCERGIQTCESYTRFTLDLSAVAAAKELTHLPVVVDPSHATGKPSLIPAMSKAAVVAGADGLLVEVHVAPERMNKPGDGPQALLPHQFKQLVQDLNNYISLENKKVKSSCLL